MSLPQTAILAVYAVLMTTLCVFSFHAYLMVVLYRRRRAPNPSPDAPTVWPHVTVQLPIYNERYVVQRLIEAACALDYPTDKLEIQVLDDSTDDTRGIIAELVHRYRAAGIDITHIHRTDRTGFKAGALKAGLDSAKGEFLAIFDADFVPPSDFLERTIPHFRDADVAVTQGRWGHLNRDYSRLTQAAAVALDAHFVLEHGARNAHGLFINFNGTAGVWRKTAILDAGNWQADTLTEDVDISYRAQLRGWRLVYLNDVVCEGEIPAEVHGLKNQQYRWAKGTIQTAKKLIPRIWRTKTLSPLAKWEASTHLTNHLVFPVMLLMVLLSWPMLHLKVTTEVSRVYFAVASIFIVFAGSYPLFYAYAQRELYDDWKRQLLFVPLLMACAVGMSVINSKAVISAVLNRKSPFIRTPKYRLGDKPSSMRGKAYRGSMDATAIVELALALYSAASVWYAVTHGEIAAIPFLLLPCVGFGWIGGLSALQAFRHRALPWIMTTGGSPGLNTAKSLD